MVLTFMESFGDRTIVDEFYTNFNGVQLTSEDGPFGTEAHCGTYRGTTSLRTPQFGAASDWVVMWSMGWETDYGPGNFHLYSLNADSVAVDITATAGTLPWHYRFNVGAVYSKNIPMRQKAFFAARFGPTGTTIYRWDGSAWEQLLDEGTALGTMDCFQFNIFNQHRWSNITIWQQSSLPAGPVFVGHSIANGDLGPNEWQPSDGVVSHHTALDDNTGYLMARGAGLTERFAFSVPSEFANDAAVKGLEVRALARRGAAAAQQFRLSAWSSAASTQGSEELPSSTIRAPFRVAVPDDPDGGAWTVNSLDLAEIGAVST